jgi:hypothetical protein
MKMSDVRTRGAELGLKIGGIKKVEAIRAIQRAEGNEPCFGSGKVDCAQVDCCWREDCLPRRK